MSSEKFLKFQPEQHQCAGQQIGLYFHYPKKDSCAGDLKCNAEKVDSPALQAHLDATNREHGDFYIDSVLPPFRLLLELDSTRSPPHVV